MDSIVRSGTPASAPDRAVRREGRLLALLDGYTCPSTCSPRHGLAYTSNTRPRGIPPVGGIPAPAAGYTRPSVTPWPRRSAAQALSSHHRVNPSRCMGFIPEKRKKDVREKGTDIGLTKL